MDKQLLYRYFSNQCSIEEIEQVLNWFQTKKGREYIENHLDSGMQRYAEEENLLFYPDVPTEKMLTAINQRKRAPLRVKRRNPWIIKSVVAVLICGILVGINYFMPDAGVGDNEEPVIEYRTISTQNDQNRLVTLSEGTRIRLNSNSSIIIPEFFSPNERKIVLNGEAWFDVTEDKDRPLSIQANRANIQVLGTEFNVKVDTVSRNVQVAVAEGKVSLNNESNANGTEAILTQNTFAVFDLDTDEILIEHSPVENYMSWISGRLYFYNEPLWVVSRYLERLYDTEFIFDQEYIKDLPLSTDMDNQELTKVLDIISKTLNIGYLYEEDTVSWTTNINQ
ncbi:MAG: FecR family protein [Balneolaceae bacterium]